jgi:hypothetical protein
MNILTQEGWWEVTGDAHILEKIKFANENQESACKLEIDLINELEVNVLEFQNQINPSPEEDCQERTPIDQWLIETIFLTARKNHYPNGLGGTGGVCQVHNDADPVPTNQDPSKKYCLRRTYPLTDHEKIDPETPYFSIEMQAFVEEVSNGGIIDDSDS